MKLRWVERKVPDGKVMRADFKLHDAFRTERVLQSLELVAEHPEIFGVKDFKAYEWQDVPVWSEALRTIEWCYRSENGEGVPAMLQRFPLNEAAQRRARGSALGAGEWGQIAELGE